MLCLGLMGGALAYFTDTETSTVNKLQVGRWSVAADGGGNTVTHTFQKLVAGSSGLKTWTVTNTGTVPAFLDMSISVTENGTGNLGGLMLAHLYVVNYAGSIYGSNANPLPINGAAGGYNLNLALATGASLGIGLDWRVGGTYAPADGDKIIFAINFDIHPVP